MRFWDRSFAKIVIFKLVLKPSFVRSYMAIEYHLQKKLELNANFHVLKFTKQEEYMQTKTIQFRALEAQE